jgi:hypothetical protein
VSQVTSLARRLIAFDPLLARRTLAMLVEELGGSPDAGAQDLARVRGFLVQPDSFIAPDVGDPRTSTREWKTDFAHRENMRELALELAELLAREDGGGGIRPVGEQP